MIEFDEERTIQVRLSVGVKVALRFNEDGQGDVVAAELAPFQSIGCREVEEALDGDGELHLLDKK
jgi:hypothetical protein